MSYRCIDETAQRRLLEMVCDYPLHKRFGYQLIEAADGEAQGRFVANEETINIAGVVHGGVWYTLLDVVAFCAAITRFAPETNASTIDLHVSVMKGVTLGETVELRGRVVRSGRTLMFCESEALLGAQRIAHARITKAIVPMPSWP